LERAVEGTELGEAKQERHFCYRDPIVPKIVCGHFLAKMIEHDTVGCSFGGKQTMKCSHAHLQLLRNSRRGWFAGFQRIQNSRAYAIGNVGAGWRPGEPIDHVSIEYREQRWIAAFARHVEHSEGKNQRILTGSKLNRTAEIVVILWRARW